MNLTQDPLLGQNPASFWSPAVVLPNAEARLPHSFADCSSTELDQLHQTLSGRLGVLRHKHRWLPLEKVLLVLPCRQVPLEATYLGMEGDSLTPYCSFSVQYLISKHFQNLDLSDFLI